MIVIESNAADFLSMCTGLQEFQLCFRNDWVETGCVFAAIAETVILPRLKKLSLQLFRCEGVHLHQFLSNHTSLRSLFLRSLDITGSTPFTKALELLEHQHNLLSEFKFEQIAQNSMRLYLATLGQTETYPFWRHPGEEEFAFFDDFMEISGPSKYHGIAEEWEWIPGRIGRLKDDVRISDLDYHSDVDSDVYWWID
ncbi:hypothetical protein PRZ48_006453 [Zasmidium cellare]|uniref:Uncharacterized protein n=1 Tax=Zasmidium cellare TaxID=395010 RepID=A0ABR0EN52_ZASCE|nr:hypothetical protein PRZ48_006453 [Zasmidium cellare]